MEAKGRRHSVTLKQVKELSKRLRGADFLANGGSVSPGRNRGRNNPAGVKLPSGRAKEGRWRLNVFVSAVAVSACPDG
jgi:hypothetical protein